MEIHRSVEGELQDILSGQSVFGDGLLNVSRAPPFCDVLLLPSINDPPYGDSLAVPTSEEV